MTNSPRLFGLTIEHRSGVISSAVWSHWTLFSGCHRGGGGGWHGWAEPGGAMRDARVIETREQVGRGPGHDKWIEYRAGIMWHTAERSIVNLTTHRRTEKRISRYRELYWDCCVIEWISEVCNICMNGAGDGSDHCKHSPWPHTEHTRVPTDVRCPDTWQMMVSAPHHRLCHFKISKYSSSTASRVCGNLSLCGSGSGEYSPMVSDGRGSGGSVVTGHLSSSHPMTSGESRGNQGLLCDQWHWHQRGLGSLITSSFFSVNHFNQNFDRRGWFNVLWWRALTIK